MAVENTLTTAGRAMLTTSVVLSLGFFIFMCAEMNIFFYFGLLAGNAVLSAKQAGVDALVAQPEGSGDHEVPIRQPARLRS